MKDKYRVKEYMSTFVIEKQIKTTKKKLFSRKVIEEMKWYGCDRFGYPVYFSEDVCIYYSLAEAQIVLQLIEEGVSYHYLDK